MLQADSTACADKQKAQTAREAFAPLPVYGRGIVAGGVLAGHASRLSVENENGYAKRHNRSMIRVLQLEQGVNLFHSHPWAN